MSTSIPGRGKQRKNGQDLNTGAMHMGGGQMVMPPNGGNAFVTPTVQQAGHAPADYARTDYSINYLPQPPIGGSQGASIVVPAGVNAHQVQTQPYANMSGPPPNNRVSGADGVPNPSMQWQNPQQQQHIMQTQRMGGMPPQHMQPRMIPQGGFYPQQPPQTMGYSMPTGYYNQYQPPQQYTAEQQQAYYQQQYYGAQMMQQPQHMQQQGGFPAHMHSQAPPTMQQGGVPPAAVAPGMGGVQPNHGMAPVPGAVPSSYPNSAPVSVQQPHAATNVPIMNPAMQQQQTRPNIAATAPVAPKKKNILSIVNPDTKETVNKDAVEASEREVDAPKAEKEEAKGTDEMDSAAPEVKKQFAEQIQQIEQTTKSDQPAPAPAPAQPAKRQTNKCLFNLDQLKELKLEEKVAEATAAAAAAAAEEEKKEQPKESSEYLPERLPAPAYPNNYKEKQQEKQTSPDVTITEMPAVNNDENRDDSHLAERTPPQDEETHASSSSEKNTSNDSAICVNTPITSPELTAEKKSAVVIVEPPVVVAAATSAAVEEETPAAEEAEPVEAAVPIEKKLAQLEIVESLSQDEAEASEPSTPAPVTPSVSETNTTLAEEEEDAEKAAAAAEEELQRKKAELEEEAVKLQNDPNQCDESKGRYNREFLYNTRDYEMLFRVTPCPLEPQQLKELGVCRSLASNEPNKKRQDGQGGFMPSWGRQGGGGAPRSDRKAYQGRQSEQHQRAGPRGAGSNKKLPPQIRPSIERRVDTNVQLHKAANAWKGDKVAADDESDEAAKKLLLKNVRGLFNKITPTTKDALIDEFLAYKVYETAALNDVISIIFDKAVEEPKFCPLYSNLCIGQVNEELHASGGVSKFRNAILQRAQETFSTKTMDDFKAEKEAEIAAEEDEKKKKEKQIELLEAMSKFRRRKFGNITFIGQLYLQSLLSIRIIHFCIVDLLKSVADKKTSNADGEVDEESVDCAVRLMETIGKRLQEETKKQTEEPKTPAQKGGAKGAPAPAPPKQAQQAFPFDLTFATLSDAKQYVCSRIRFMIDNLLELRAKNWVPRSTKDAGPKKLDEIKKDMEREQMANQQAQQQYERKVSRGGMGGGPMGGHGGGGGGGHGGNPKRQVIQRNSLDRGTLEDRRSQAHKSSTLVRGNAPPQKKQSLSSVTTSDRASLGGSNKSKWSGGASGGSENSKKEDRAAALQSAARIGGGNPRSSSQASMKEEDGANASGTATEVNSEEERENNEKKEQLEGKITTRVLSDGKDFAEGEIKIDEVRDEMFKTVGNEKWEKPSIDVVFKCLMTAATMRRLPIETTAKFGHVLSYCLLKKAEEKNNKERDEILKGVTDFCKEVVDKEIWEDVPKIWDFVAEVLINAHQPPEGLFEGAHATLVDFKDAFLTAARDDRKPYTLFVLVLKRVAEIHYARDKDNYLDAASWVLDECEPITKKIDMAKLDKVLKETKMEFIDNLYDILRSHQ